MLDIGFSLVYNKAIKSREENKMTNSKRTTKGDLECKASQYRLHDAALEVLRQTPGILTMAEAIAIAKARGY